MKTWETVNEAIVRLDAERRKAFALMYDERDRANAAEAVLWRLAEFTGARIAGLTLAGVVDHLWEFVDRAMVRPARQPNVRDVLAGRPLAQPEVNLAGIRTARASLRSHSHA